jgi:hypothetical protein
MEAHCLDSKQMALAQIVKWVFFDFWGAEPWVSATICLVRQILWTVTNTYQKFTFWNSLILRELYDFIAQTAGWTVEKIVAG